MPAPILELEDPCDDYRGYYHTQMRRKGFIRCPRCGTALGARQTPLERFDRQTGGLG